MFFNGKNLYIEWHEAAIPWLKLFAAEPSCKELTDCRENTLADLWRATLICERTLRDYYKPDKINIASFGNRLPRVHIHIMARFTDDSHFPEPMWGERQRADRPAAEDRAIFESKLIAALNKAGI
ncbi:MAG: HIT family protein [Helicobacteraceae bacterium]|jgi:diadenosine tetraphosphate (Ap4A) HIT family hydrolase|nr:HIT family protein [Helicobacteraceae bacterium]